MDDTCIYIEIYCEDCLLFKWCSLIYFFVAWPFSADAYCKTIKYSFFPRLAISSDSKYSWVCLSSSRWIKPDRLFFFIPRENGFVFRFWQHSGSDLLTFRQQHVQSIAEGWAVLLVIVDKSLAELNYIASNFSGSLMEELILGFVKICFLLNIRDGLDLLLPSILFALLIFQAFPSSLDIFVLQHS